ncbi:PEP-CTERM sorting domain-containing protein [Nostoc sp. UHCC 0870]|uniref:PEP-CTERM sorting domain-containing protein n=1 Tax=Nostoc sp. UHCC 0870 TaxID=2914041 RepID=UPI001EE11876|nr:PEP-CTERM sorting domain-containing protein [Nostoc sp. UHCC 0870]UKP00952.1 PEP-CTERM sorting domain-containing protein [Nostoc sp. UHCC 0870]
MKTTIKVVGILAGSSLLISSPVQAVDLNFSTNPSSWTTFGDVNFSSSTEALLSTDANADDDFQLGAINGQFNFSGQPAREVGFVSPNLTEFLGINADALDINGVAFEGSAIKLTINVQAGEYLTFQWNFLTNENSSLVSGSNRGSLNDYSFFLVNDQIQRLGNIDDAQVSNPNFPLSFAQETGIKTFQYTFNNSGIYTIAFGVVDVDDFTVSSALSVSNVVLERKPTGEPVPEPSSVLGIIIALGFGALSRKTQSSKNNNQV